MSMAGSTRIPKKMVRVTSHPTSRSVASGATTRPFPAPDNARACRTHGNHSACRAAPRIVWSLSLGAANYRPSRCFWWRLRPASHQVHHVKSAARPICSVALSLLPTAGGAQPPGDSGLRQAARNPTAALADPPELSRRSLAARALPLDLLATIASQPLLLSRQREHRGLHGVASPKRAAA